MSQDNKALFIIFGGTGDLAHRKLYPALYRLYKKNYLSENFAVIGTARREWSDDYYQDVVMDSIKDISESEAHSQQFASHFRYQSHNVNDSEHYDTLKTLADTLDEEYNLEGNRVFYLSMSPSFFGTIASHLKEQNLVTEKGFNRVVIEKPFGVDHSSSKELNDEISASFDESQIYRIDHYLGKEMVQTILALRFANRLFKDSWNKDAIDNIQITLSEALGVEERGEYYDKTGALKDMVQNHMLQVLTLLTMDAPASFTTEDVRDQKVAVLNALQTPQMDGETPDFIRGQYADSEDDSKPAYRKEDKVDPESLTDTFVAGKVLINNDTWEGVPIYIRTGKRMKAKESRVDIVWKKTESDLFDEDTTYLTIHMGPKEGVELFLNDKKIGPGMDTTALPLQSFRSEETISDSPEAYEKLILDVILGDETHFAHWGEVSQSWKFVDTIKDAWDVSGDSIPFYPSDSMGPKEAFDLLERDNRYWIWNP